MHYDLISFDSAEALARNVAQRWLADLAATAKPKPYCVALSGGRIARRFFTAVANLGRSQQNLFGSVHFFWADERCVPPGDEESNFGLAQICLFQPLQIAPERVHRLAGEVPPAQAAAAAAAELRLRAPANAAGIPVLDLVLLGMGEDGHIASLFPQTPLVTESPAVYMPVEGPKPPPRRITLTLPVLGAAKRAWVLVSGPDKGQAFRDSISGDGRTPLARLLRERVNTQIFVDKISILPVDSSGH